MEDARLVKPLLIAGGNVEGVEAHTELEDDDLDAITVNCTVSCDGTWKNRGHESHHCITPVINNGTGEVLDSEVPKLASSPVLLTTAEFL